MRIAVLAVVEVLDLVDRIAGQHRRRRGLGPGAGQGQVLLALRAVHFQLVQARISAAGAEDRQPHEPGFMGREGDRVRRSRA